MTLCCSSLRLGIRLSLVKPRDHPVKEPGEKGEKKKKKGQQMEKNVEE